MAVQIARRPGHLVLSTQSAMRLEIHATLTNQRYHSDHLLQAVEYPIGPENELHQERLRLLLIQGRLVVVCHRSVWVLAAITSRKYNFFAGQKVQTPTSHPVFPIIFLPILDTREAKPLYLNLYRKYDFS